MGEGECCSGFGERVCQLTVCYHEVQRDRGPTGSLELHGRRESRKDSKYPRRILVGETPEPWKKGRGSVGSRLGKEPIEIGMS